MMKTFFPRVLLATIFLVGALRGAVHEIQISERKSVADGKSFGSAGQYEEVIAKAYFRVDPKNAANRIISDIDLAPVNADGLVEFSADLHLIKPRDTAKGNRAILFDVLNRGNKVMLSHFNFAGRGAGEIGDGFLLEQGFTLVWLGWQFDVPREPARMRLNVTVARNEDGSPVIGLVRADFVPDRTLDSHSVADRDHIPYAALDPNDQETQITVRDRVDSPRRTIAREKWSFNAEGTAVIMKAGFEAGKIYEVAYKAKDPALVGLGPAAIRDIVTFLKYGSKNGEIPLAADAKNHQRALSYGVSQSGRFLRTFLYYGFNKDEEGRQVFDGVWSHVAGGGRGSFNHRFAQASRDAHPHMNFFHPTDIFPFTDLEETDPVTGWSGGILEKAIADGVAPKVFYTNTSYEYWGRAASLIHTTIDGERDARLAKDTRIYLLAGSQHGAPPFPPDREVTQNLSNTNDYRWALRALMVAFDRWVKDGTEPPESRYPRIDRKQLVPLEDLAFPKIPGVRRPTTMHHAYRVDYGPEFYTKGIVQFEPPKVGKAYPMRVPQVDTDGNETSGIQLPMLARPLGTFTGWNHRAPRVGAPEMLANMIGSYIPFARTKAEREKTGDPRPSIEERYKNREAYRKALSEAAREVVSQGFLRNADAKSNVEAGMAQWDFVMKEQ